MRLRVSNRAGVLLAVCLGGCASGLNYGSDGPRYTGMPTPILGHEPVSSDTLRIASFNIEFALRVDSAIAVLRSHPQLRRADVVMLQEMDGEGTRRIAEALGMWFTYYPATFSLRTGRDFGNAILSRWPIIEDAKILLPHISRFRRTRRAATAATIQAGSASIRVYSAHLGTLADVGPNGRRDQLRAILDDAARYARVVIAGDMNSAGVGRVARVAGYEWPTEDGPPTIRLWRWDHIFLKGFTQPDSAAAGAVRAVKGASDHRPVWATAIIREGTS